jgi:NADPH-dependent 2,4-dienoyl-CoA reductase/sulfur reductase-like enzyme/rhodanese-related sulfurtransferase
VLRLPLGDGPAARLEGDKRMIKPFKVVIVGGVAAGPKAASKIIRLRSDAEVTLVDKGKALSYAGCGLPFYISGVVKDQKELMSTPAGALRDPVFFQKVKHVSVMDQTEAVEIDRTGRRIRVRDRLSGRENWLEYDKLVLATGASPIVPQVPGVKLRNIFTLHGVSDAEGIKAALAAGKARDVVIVGGGLIGVEVTEALAQKGCRVTIVEMQPQMLRILDWEIAKLVEHHMEARGVKVLTEAKVESFQGDGKVSAVVTTRGTLPADMVILGIGVRPNVLLAGAAGLELGATGAIKVDDHMRTSDPDIYAAGDCVESVDLVTGDPVYAPLGSTANKQGRVAAVNVCGGDDTFPGVLGTTICKVFDYAVARTGLTETWARRLGYDVVSVLVPGPDRAHYMPNARMLMLKLVVDAKTRRLLGAQATGPGAADKRIDVAAMAITAGMTVDRLAAADLSYAPPYSDAMDNIITAANVARNKLAGHMVGITPMELREMTQQKRDFVLLDVRSPEEYEHERLPNSRLIPLGSLRGQMEELPRDREIVVFCNISLRAYEAALILRAGGFDRVRVLDGGLAMWPYEKVEG